MIIGVLSITILTKDIDSLHIFLIKLSINTFLSFLLWCERMIKKMAYIHI